jgi:hypothetical protein
MNLLGAGETGLNVSTFVSPSEGSRWVFHELRDVNTADEWKNYLKSGRHFWLLHNVLGLTANKAALVEAMVALGECVNHVHRSGNPNSPKKAATSPTDAQWIVRLAKSQLSAKPELGKKFIEAVFAIGATAALSEELRSKNDRLCSQLQKANEDLIAERQAKDNAEVSVQRLQQELATAVRDLAESRTALEEERKHTLRTGGFSSVSRRETVTQVLAVVRQGVTHRLESIRQFADRENPNKDEILDLVKEIEKHLAGVEERLNQ